MNVWCNVFSLSMFMIYGCNVCACELICCIAVYLRKINPCMSLRICWIFMSWSWSIDKNSVVRAMSYTVWGICLGNPENFDDFYWGLFNGSLCSVGEYQKSAVIRLDFRLQKNLLGNLEKLDGFHRGLIVWSFSSVGDLNDLLWGLLME